MRVDDERLDRILARLDLEVMPEPLEATAPGLLRGHHVALLAAEGSGKEAIYALALLETDLSQEDDGLAGGAGTDAGTRPAPRALVLAASDERVERVARALHASCGPEGVDVCVFDPATPEESLASPCLVGRPSVVLPEIRSGRLPLGDLSLLVLDGVSEMAALDEWTSAEAVVDTLPAEVRRVAASGSADASFRELVERRMQRARRWPSDLFQPGQEPAGPGREVRVAIAAGESRWRALDACRRDAAGRRLAVLCGSAEAAREAAAALGVRGATVRIEGAVATADGDAANGEEAVVLLGPPLRPGETADRLGAAARRYAVTDPARAAQLELVLGHLGFRSAPLQVPFDTGELDAVRVYRQRLRRRVREADVAPELLILEPLLEEFGAARVAATLSALLRRGGDGKALSVSWPDLEAALGEGAAATHPEPSPGAQAPRGTRSAWSRIWIGIGKRDDVRPGDLVGAITGEARIAGGQIGKIEILGSFSLVEIDSMAVDQVLRRLQGVTIRGRQVAARRDRES
jgi:ATP-dependent RNA helicase DeaD